MNSSGPTKHVLYVVNDSWFFCSHRLVLATASLKAGFSVALASQPDESTATVVQNGIDFYPWKISPRSFNPLRELIAFVSLARIVHRNAPDILHLVTIKAMLQGGILARIFRVPAVVYAVSGLGQIYSRHTLRARCLRAMVERIYRFIFAHKNCLVFVQNYSDRDLLIERKLVTETQLRLLPGSGVDLEVFSECPPSDEDGLPIILLASRMIWDKGIAEFVEAARRINHERPRARFVLAGQVFPTRSGAVPEETLKAWADEGIIEWRGFCKDTPKLIGESAIVTLPTTYGEGLPKVLLEAGAAGKPIVCTDWPGCRELVRNNETGLLITPGSVDALVDALEQLLISPGTRLAMGRAGRSVIESHYSVERVVDITLSSYADLLSRH